MGPFVPAEWQDMTLDIAVIASSGIVNPIGAVLAFCLALVAGKQVGPSYDSAACFSFAICFFLTYALLPPVRYLV
jgi:hypothetical protein